MTDYEEIFYKWASYYPKGILKLPEISEETRKKLIMQITESDSIPIIRIQDICNSREETE